MQENEQNATTENVDTTSQEESNQTSSEETTNAGVSDQSGMVLKDNSLRGEETTSPVEESHEGNVTSERSKYVPELPATKPVIRQLTEEKKDEPLVEAHEALGTSPE